MTDDVAPEASMTLLEENQRADRLALRCQLLFDTMLQGVVYQDGDGKILSMNPSAERPA